MAGFSAALLFCSNGSAYPIFLVYTPGIGLDFDVQPPVPAGDGAGFSIYLEPTGKTIDFSLADTTTGQYYTWAADAHGAIYKVAGAGVVPPPGSASVVKQRLAQFLQGRLTTVSGDRGTFTGPWSTYRIVETSNGLDPARGTPLASPCSLWAGGGLPGDSFGVWWYPY